ncbi:MAG: hypothetical protein ACI4OG_04105 [Bacilli bacterium]
MNKNIRKIIGIILLIICFCVVGYLIYNYGFSNKNKMFEILSDNIEMFESNEELDKKIKISSNTLLDMGTENTLTVSGDYYFDYENDKIYSSLVGKVDNVELFTPELYFENDTLYFKIKQISDKLVYLKTSEDDSDSEYKFNDDQLEEIINIVKKAIDKNLSNNNFDKEKTEITLEENNVKVTKYTMNVSYGDAYNIICYVVDELETNKKLSNLSQYLFENTTASQIKQELKEKMFKNNKETDRLFTYSIYVNSKNIILKNELEFSGGKINLSYYDNSYKSKNLDFEVVYEDVTYVKASIIGQKDASKINIDLMSMITLEGNTKESENSSTLELSIKAPLLGFEEMGKIVYEKKEIVKDKEYDVNFLININVDKEKLALTSINKLYFDVDIPVFNKENAVDYNSLGSDNEFTRFFKGLTIGE